jgi:SAM-dependent methyltransferase
VSHSAWRATIIAVSSHPTDRYAADQPYYDAWNEREDDLAFWVTATGWFEGKILEIGVGTGRVAFPLASYGRDVTGIDASPAMLAAARARMARLGVRVALHELDAADAAECPGAPFDIAILPNDAFLHASTSEAQVAWLDALHRALVPEGVVIVDLPGPALWLDATTNGQPLLMYHVTAGDGVTLDVWHVHEDDLVAQQRLLTIIYDRVAPDGTLARTYGEHDLLYVYPREAYLLLEQAGFVVDSAFGDYSFGSMTSESERMILVARKVQA